MFDPYQSDVSQQVQILLNLEIDLDTLKILRHTYHDMMLKSQHTGDTILNLQNDRHGHIDQHIRLDSLNINHLQKETLHHLGQDMVLNEVASNTTTV